MGEEKQPSNSETEPEEFTVRVGTRGGRLKGSYIITIPKKVAERLAIKKGTELTYQMAKDVIVLGKVTPAFRENVITDRFLQLLARIREIREKERKLELKLIEGGGDPFENQRLRREIDSSYHELNIQFDTIKEKTEDLLKRIGPKISYVGPLQTFEDLIFLADRQAEEEFRKRVRSISEYLDELVRTRLQLVILLSKLDSRRETRTVSDDEYNRLSKEYNAKRQQVNDTINSLRRILA